MNNYSVYEHVFPNGKRYIGMTKNISQRWGNGGTGYSGNKQMMKDIEKYGWENIQHNIIADNLSRREAQTKERELIERFDSIRNGYNNHPGGTAGTTYYCQHVTKMLSACRYQPNRFPYSQYRELADMMYELSDDEGWAYQVNLVDYVIRTEVDGYEREMQNEPFYEAIAWWYYISQWVLHPETDIRTLPGYHAVISDKLKEWMVKS